MRRAIITALMALVVGGVAVPTAQAHRRVVIRTAPTYYYYPYAYYDPFWTSSFYDPFWGPSYTFVPKTAQQIQAENEARAIRHQRHEEKKLEKQRAKAMKEQQKLEARGYYR